jgi:hypothetical protein
MSHHYGDRNQKTVGYNALSAGSIGYASNLSTLAESKWQLHAASVASDVRAVSKLIDAGADANALDDIFRATPLYILAVFGTPNGSLAATARVLMSNGADPNWHPANNVATALDVAIARGNRALERVIELFGGRANTVAGRYASERGGRLGRSR